VIAPGVAVGGGLVGRGVGLGPAVFVGRGVFVGGSGVFVGGFGVFVALGVFVGFGVNVSVGVEVFVGIAVNVAAISAVACATSSALIFAAVAAMSGVGSGVWVGSGVGVGAATGGAQPLTTSANAVKSIIKAFMVVYLLVISVIDLSDRSHIISSVSMSVLAHSSYQITVTPFFHLLPNRNKIALTAAISTQPANRAGTTG
jgi:hypothetical protein